MAQDLTYGDDGSGTTALFLEEKHFVSDGWKLGKKASEFLKDNKEMIYFRVIKNGVQQSGHGWLEDDKVFQWG